MATVYGKTLGQLAYERDVLREPLYHDGIQRRQWDEIGAAARWSWERNPTDRQITVVTENSRG